MADAVATGPILTSSEGIVILPDTIRTVLHERRPGNDGSVSLACVGIVITIAITFATATFKDVANVPAAFTKALFFLSAIFFSIAGVVYFFRYVANRERTQVNSIVAELEKRAAIKNTQLTRRL